jgi:hypothetical protein
MERRRVMDNNSPATTPGMDDTPYIRFAIDQLTRDEEVRGSRRYPGIPEERESMSEDSYPVNRIIPDEGLGYVKKPPPAATAGYAFPGMVRQQSLQSATSQSTQEDTGKCEWNLVVKDAS